MNPSSHYPRQREKYRELRRHHPDADEGFVCILDLRPECRNVESRPKGHLIPWAILLSLVLIFSTLRIPPHPTPPLQPDADALRLAAWESPTGFLLADEFHATHPD